MQIIETVPGSGRIVGLTFDDGPSPADTPRLLSVLRRHRVQAVFCLVGRNAYEHPQLVRDIVADGHALGNHTMCHDDMSERSKGQIAADLRETITAIRRALPGVEVPYFRAPYGRWGASLAVAADLGMRPLGWRLAVGDWEMPGTEVLVRRIQTGLVPSAVVLLHDGGGDRTQTVDAVERAIPQLLAEGWTFALPA
jgi:peptidoglycan-N-acetylglucosamine deacetylase